MKKDSELVRSENKRLNTVLKSVQADLKLLTAQHESEKIKHIQIEKQLSVMLKRLEENEKMIEKNSGSITVVKKLANSGASNETVSDGPSLWLCFWPV
jgi:hypothetical protein